MMWTKLENLSQQFSSSISLPKGMRLLKKNIVKNLKFKFEIEAINSTMHLLNRALSIVGMDTVYMYLQLGSVSAHECVCASLPYAVCLYFSSI